MFGRGIYFGEPVKAIGYTSKGYDQKACYLLEAEVALGTPLVAPKAEKYTLSKIRAAGFNSVHGRARTTVSWAGTLHYDEWVVYSTEQVRLLYVHEFQATIRVDEAPRSHACQMLVVPKVFNTRGKRSFMEVLEKPRVCGLPTFTPLKVAGGAQVWVCQKCLETPQHRVRIGDRLQVWLDGKAQDVKVKG